MKIIIPSFVAALLAVPISSGVMAGAVSVPEVLRLISPSSKESTARANETSRDNRQDDRDRRQDRDADKSPVAPVAPAANDKPQQPDVSAIKPAQSAPRQSTVTSASTEVARAPAAPPDTSDASKSLAAAQAQKSVQPVYYQSAKISVDNRNELLRISLIIAGSAVVLYAVSYAGLLWRLFYGESVAVRHTLTQQN